MTAGTDVNFGALTKALLEPLQVHCAHEVLDLKRDGDRWRVEVRDVKRDTVLFAHRYEPETLREKSLALITQAGTLLGMPYGNAKSFLRAPGPRTHSPRDVYLFDDPLFSGRSRAGLFALGLALAAGMIVLVVKRLRARGANPLLIAGASLLVAIFGVPAFLLVRALEPRRAARAPREPQSAELTELLIQSA